MGHIIDVFGDRGELLLSEETSHYSLLRRYKFSKTDKAPGGTSIDSVSVVPSYLSSERFHTFPNEFHEYCIEIYLPQLNPKDLFAIHCGTPGVMFRTLFSVGVLIILAYIPKNLIDFLLIAKSITVYHFTLQNIANGNIGLQVFAGGGDLIFYSGAAAMRILAQEAIYKTVQAEQESEYAPRGEYLYDKDLAVILFHCEKTMHLVDVFDENISGFYPFGTQYFLNFPMRGQAAFRKENYGSDWLPSPDDAYWDGNMGIFIGYMIIDVTGL